MEFDVPINELYWNFRLFIYFSKAENFLKKGLRFSLSKRLNLCFLIQAMLLCVCRQDYWKLQHDQVESVELKVN